MFYNMYFYKLSLLSTPTMFLIISVSSKVSIPIPYTTHVFQCVYLYTQPFLPSVSLS